MTFSSVLVAGERGGRHVSDGESAANYLQQQAVVSTSTRVQTFN